MRRSILAAIVGFVIAGCSANQAPTPANAPLRFLLINDVYFGDTTEVQDSLASPLSATLSNAQGP